MNHWQQRAANQDRWPNVPFVERKEKITLREAMTWAVLLIALYGVLGLYLGA